MKLFGLMFIGFLSFAGSVSAQTCPSGIPSANNPGCIPPDDPLSPYYQGSQDEEQPAQPVQQPPPQPTGYWEKTWGAIATSETGGALGTALGASSEGEAKQIALADCKAKGGGGCEAGFAYHNQCAVVVLGDRFLRLFGDESIEKASSRGLSVCGNNNCRVYYSACTEPIYHQY